MDAPIATLSGGNVQRAVLARELTGEVDLLVVANPCFGLDFSAVAEIRSRIVAARNGGAAVLLISEDLDEILELSDRILVMSEGRIVYETPGAERGRCRHRPAHGGAPLMARDRRRAISLPSRPGGDGADRHRHAARLHRAGRLRREPRQ